MDTTTVVATDDSVSLRSLTGGSCEDFFANKWQKCCCVFPFNKGSGLIEGEADLFQDLINMGLDGLIPILEKARQIHKQSSDQTVSGIMNPLVFREQQALSIEEVQNVYGASLFAAYLDGCSVVLNHADCICPHVAAVCLDLQKSFPHAYANAYLTPPSSRAVQAHADDRDVLIIQLYGQKHWKVYQNIPIPFPYPEEQVGKEGLSIPPSVLEGPCIVDTTLKAGDVLYMPRGYVHIAETDATQPSFHVTIALATHDWTLARILTSATKQILESVVDYRMAVPVQFGMCDVNSIPHRQVQDLQLQIDDALQRVKEKISVESVCEHLHNKCENHNQRALPMRLTQINRAKGDKSSKYCPAVCGLAAAESVTLSTTLRASTPAEKESVSLPSSQPRGLHVRPETADAIMEMLQKLKGDGSRNCRVSELPSLLESPCGLVCSLTLVSFAKLCVELGALVIVKP